VLSLTFPEQVPLVLQGVEYSPSVPPRFFPPFHIVCLVKCLPPNSGRSQAFPFAFHPLERLASQCVVLKFFSSSNLPGLPSYIQSDAVIKVPLVFFKLVHFRIRKLCPSLFTKQSPGASFRNRYRSRAPFSGGFLPIRMIRDLGFHFSSETRHRRVILPPTPTALHPNTPASIRQVSYLQSR